MDAVSYRWSAAGREYLLQLVRVAGTNGDGYSFGESTGGLQVDVPEFFIATAPVTQALWLHVMGDKNPALNQGLNLPVENVSWDDITGPGGFLERINQSTIRPVLSEQLRRLSGNTPPEVVRTGATGSSSAAATTSTRSPGMTAGTAITRNRSA